MAANELKPCPRCESTNIKIDARAFGNEVYCADCGLCTDMWSAEDKAVGQWNGEKRAELRKQWTK
jgi:transcription initiation factor TFIIIB Brf1 subunit/transcription initiation factor TFIIB